MRQLIPGHYVYSKDNAGRDFSSGIIVTDEGAVVVDALDSEAIAVKLQRYEQLPNYAGQREVVVRRMYKELTGSLP